MMGDELTSKNRQSQDVCPVSPFGGQIPISACKTESVWCL